MDNIFVSLIKNVLHKIKGSSTDNDVSIPLSSFNNYNAKDAQVDYIASVAPYGIGSLANRGSKCLVIPVFGTNQHLVSVGIEMVVPPCKVQFSDGESWIYSNKYVLSTQNDTVNAYRIKDADYFATLPNGQFIGAMMLNRINELQAQISYLTTLVGQLQNHSHPSNGATPSQTFTTPSTPATLAQDKNYIEGENYLISDKGTMYGT